MAAAGLRIAFVVDVCEGVKNGGVVSAQRFVAELRRRHQVTVISTGAPGPDKVVLPAFRPPPFGRLMREMGFTFAVPRRAALEEAFRRAEVIHVQFPFWLGFRAAAIARRMGRPLVAAFHVQPENLYRNVGLRWQRLDDWTYRLFLTKLFQRADAVVCPTPFALEELRRRGLETPAEVISNGIAPEFAPAPLARHERHRGKFLLLAVGRLAREKRHDVIVEGVRRSRHASHIQLVITGRGPEEARVRRLGAALPLPAEVGFLSDEALRHLLVTADLLVHASEVELEGMAVLEALGCGTPALIADSPASATPALAPSPEFLFRPGDAADLARRLDALIDHPARLTAARSRCLELAAGHALEGSVRKLEALYLRLAFRGTLRTPAPTVAGGTGAGSRALPGAR